jgi:hypothetical protein
MYAADNDIFASSDRNITAKREGEILTARKRLENKKLIESSTKQLIHESAVNKAYILKNTVRPVGADPHVHGFYLLNVIIETNNYKDITADNDTFYSEGTAYLDNPFQSTYALSYYVADCNREYSPESMVRYDLELMDTNYTSKSRGTEVRADKRTYASADGISIYNKSGEPEIGINAGDALPQIFATICKSDNIVTNILSMGYDNTIKMPYYSTEDGKRLYFTNDRAFTCDVCYQHSQCRISGTTNQDNLLISVNKSIARNRYGRETVCNNGDTVTTASGDEPAEHADNGSMATEIIDKTLRSYYVASMH